MISEGYQLKSSTKAAVQAAFDAKNYPAAYQAIADDLIAQNAAAAQAGLPPTVDADTITWYTSAPQINDQNSNSFIHNFVRDYVSKYAELTVGKSVTDQFQVASDALAKDILSQVIQTGVAQPFSQVGIGDTRNAVNEFAKLGIPISQYAWPAYAELAAGVAPNFTDHSFLDNIPLDRQLDILSATRSAGAQAFHQAPLDLSTLIPNYINGLALDSRIDGLLFNTILGYQPQQGSFNVVSIQGVSNTTQPSTTQPSLTSSDGGLPDPFSGISLAQLPGTSFDSYAASTPNFNIPISEPYTGVVTISETDLGSLNTSYSFGGIGAAATPLSTFGNPGDYFTSPYNSYVPFPITNQAPVSVPSTDGQSGSLDYPIYASGYGDYSGSYGGGDDGYSPVILDLTGNGINITQLSSSSTFFNTAGNGTQHLTAWAGAGNGVLFYDPTGTGQLTQADQIDFTDWDPSATSDMQALLDVFDTNHDGALDAGDASFADFYVMETNANGTQTAVSLASLGIAAVNLTANTVNIDLPDGSSIDGEATYTTSGGGTGTAATVTFATDANGYAVTTADTANADGSETIAHVAENADGSIAYQNILNTSITSSASGGTTTTTTNKTLSDLNSAGVVLTIQTDDSVETSNASGSTTTETLTDYQGGQVSSSGELTGSGITNSEKLDATTTTTAVNSSGTTLTIARDQLGGVAAQFLCAKSMGPLRLRTDARLRKYQPNGLRMRHEIYARWAA